ncbi:hypothetical protein U0C82_12295 [Fulvimarina sp. 2208YS6-2-32]|uniref:Alpha/beta hydrolase n=1 Tax=Fulvimarina uroteuthidis TaxID=3098149 RepID=A0ABU5I3I9_9HYPH|nr:hypothetical protein [Fulvimarina sp. 2208YS6-2-32]MDY8109918.1 hypothetical protein [Fulvimarina sp. 2208YS6-2-32]
MTQSQIDYARQIGRRLVFVFPGFEPLLPEAQVARFRRAAERSAAVFGSRVAFTPVERTDACPSDRAASPYVELDACLTGEMSGSVVKTRLVFCVWDDLIADYASKPLPRRVCDGFAALFSFVFDGTFLRYCRTSFRYGAFFLFPILVPAAILAFGILLALTLGALFTGPTTWLAGVLIGSAAAAILLYLANRRWFLLTALDDWSLARDLCNRTNPAIDRRIDAFADILRSRTEASEADEIVVAGHSLGVSLAVPALAKAYGAGLAPGMPLHLLTVGSSLMKTALHPNAGWQRDAVRRLVVDHAVPWTDCQALTDPINFYKSNPAQTLGISADPLPLVFKIRLRRMVSETTYRRIKRDFFRLHRQFVLAVERRGPYSFHMLLLGPGSMSDFRRHKTLDRPPLVSDARPPAAATHADRSLEKASE